MSAIDYIKVECLYKLRSKEESLNHRIHIRLDSQFLRLQGAESI